MKRFMIFTVSFVLLFFIFEIISGIVQTFLYTPNIEQVWGWNTPLSEKVIVKGSKSFSLPTAFFAFISGVFAYLIQRKIITVPK